MRLNRFLPFGRAPRTLVVSFERDGKNERAVETMVSTMKEIPARTSLSALLGAWRRKEVQIRIILHSGSNMSATVWQMKRNGLNAAAVPYGL